MGKATPHCHPFLLLSNYRFLSVTFSLNFELSQRVSLLLSDPLYSFTNTCTHKHSSTGASPECMGIQCMACVSHLLLIRSSCQHQTSDIWIYHCLSFCHKHKWQGNVCVRLILHGGMLSQIIVLRINLFSQWNLMSLNCKWVAECF